MQRKGRYLVQASHIHTIYHQQAEEGGNGAQQHLPWTPLVGDQYGRGLVFSAVRLEEGNHLFYAHVRAKVAGSFSLRLERAVCAHKGAPPDASGGNGAGVVGRRDGPLPLDHTSPLRVFDPPWMPDMVGGKVMGGVVAVPLINVCDTPVNVTVDVRGEGKTHDAAFEAHLDAGVVTVAPGLATYLPVHVQRTAGDGGRPGLDGNGCPVTTSYIHLHATHAHPRSPSAPHTHTMSVPLALRCREATDSFLFSFVDHDGTPSHAAAVAPIEVQHNWTARSDLDDGYSQKPTFPILLTLHGTSISPQSQADSYKRMPRGSDKYTFGAAGLWTVAPTRHGAHNWEHTGYHTALRAACALAEVFAREHSAAWYSWPTDLCAIDAEVLLMELCVCMSL